MTVPLHLTVNGKECKVSAETSNSLLSVLRDGLQLTGAKPGCGEGQCGACTVLVDGKTIRSCITPVSSIGHQSIQTIEGVTGDARLHRVQQAFLEHSAFQCGYCTTGMIMATVGLLQKIPNPTVEEIRTELNGNICRCGTYARIIKAILQAARSLEHA